MSKIREIIESHGAVILKSEFDKLEKELQKYVKDIIENMVVYGKPASMLEKTPEEYYGDWLKGYKEWKREDEKED